MSHKYNFPAIFLIGPTASGKTSISLELAKQFPIEVVSIDSAMVYKDMNIGTCKPSKEDLNAVPHHLIDIIEPSETFDIGIFMNGEEVNNTVVLVAKNNKNARNIDKFFKERLKVYNRLDDKIKTWYGDQQSYTVLLQKLGFLDKFLKDYTSRYRIYDINGLKVKFFQYGRFVKGLKKGGGLKENPTNILIDFKGPLRKQHFERLYYYVMDS